MLNFSQDLRYAVRQLRKAPGFSAVAILTLALGIGANTAVFSVLDTVLLRPLPYRQPDRLVLVVETESVSPNEDLGGVAAQEYLDYRDQNRTLSKIAAFESNSFNLTGNGTPLRIRGARMSASAFDVLGVAPMMGRAFTTAEDRTGSDNVIELSYSLWQNQYHGDPGHPRPHHQDRRSAVHRDRRNVAVVPFPVRWPPVVGDGRRLAADWLQQRCAGAAEPADGIRRRPDRPHEGRRHARAGAV